MRCCENAVRKCRILINVLLDIEGKMFRIEYSSFRQLSVDQRIVDFDALTSAMSGDLENVDSMLSGCIEKANFPAPVGDGTFSWNGLFDFTALDNSLGSLFGCLKEDLVMVSKVQIKSISYVQVYNREPITFFPNQACRQFIVNNLAQSCAA